MGADKKCDLLQLPALMSYPWLCIYGVKRQDKHICNGNSRRANEAACSESNLFLTAEKLRKVPTLNINVPFYDPS